MHFNENQFEGIILDVLCKTMYVKDLYLPRKTILVEGQRIHYHFVRQAALGLGKRPVLCVMINLI